MDEIASFGAWLRRRRKALDLTQAELADQAGCATGTIKSIEADARRPSKQLAERLANLLELHLDERAAFLKAARAKLSPDQLTSPTQLVGRAVGSPARPPPSYADQQALPTGAVTFLVTNIEGSAQLWEQHPRPMRHALARHDALLSQAIAAHQGRVIKSTGDGIHAVFAQPTDALAATLDGQRALQQEDWGSLGPLRVRMALHTGVAQERNRDYFGPALNRLARLLTAGHGGQVLLSRATAELLYDHLPDAVELRDLGQQRLKDLARPEYVFQLVAPGLTADFPPLKTLDQHRTNLPAQPTTLIGRDQEIAKLCTILRHDGDRLITLTGPGGTGKTRLAVQMAAEVLDTLVDGVWFVDLAPLSDPNLVIPTIIQTLGLKEIGGQLPLEQLKAYLRDKRLLLVLDNFEQVVDAAPRVAELLAAGPHLKVLVTSRVVLHLRGEKEYVVPPLALPDPKQLPPLGSLSQYAAVALFIQRAQDVKLDFQITNESAPAVAEICHRLDGLPLAIELAAAQVKLFAPPILLARLERRLGVLIGGPRDAPVRQQTIRNTIDWSYQLLDEAQQTLFTRLGVFVGGCTLDAIEAVCNVDDDLPVDVVEGVSALADKSLLRQTEGVDGEPRFVMLETIREYALDRLVAQGQVNAMRGRHAAYYAGLAERAETKLQGPEQVIWLDRLELEHDNLRAALAWALEVETELGLRLASALAPFWNVRCHLSEGRRWLTRAIASEGDSSIASRAKALRWAASFVWDQSDFIQAGALGEQSLALYRSLDDKRGIAGACEMVGLAARALRNYDRAVLYFEEGLALYRELGDRAGTASMLLSLGAVVWRRSDYDRARAMSEESLELYRELDDRSGVANALGTLSVVAERRGDDKRWRELREQSLQLYRMLGDKLGAAMAIWDLALIDWFHGDYDRATQQLEENLVVFQEAGIKRRVGGVLIDLGNVAWAQGDTASAHARYERADTLLQEVGDRLNMAWSRYSLGRLAWTQGDNALAYAQYAESAKLFRDAEFKPGLAGALCGLGRVASRQGEFEVARLYLAESMTIRRELGHPREIAESLEGFAALAAVLNQAERAVRLLGTASVLRQMVEQPLHPPERVDCDRIAVAAQAQLKEMDFAAAWAAGRTMTLDQAVVYALEG
jgi:predicted ATPase/class 3 adenylate cyclase